MKKLFIVGILIGLPFAVSHAQTRLPGFSNPAFSITSDEDWLTNYLTERVRLTTARDYTGDADVQKAASDGLKKALREAVGNSYRTGIIAGNTAVAKETVNADATALALMQNQQLIEQNARMIVLLESLNKKK